MKIIKRIFLLTFLLLFILLSVSCNQKGKTKILIVADEWSQMHALAREINEDNKFEIDSVGQENFPQDLKEYDFVFMYLHKVLEEKTEKSLINYANQGGTLIVFHHGIASAKMNNPAWLAFLGIKLYPAEEQYGWKVLQHSTHTLVNLSPNHFITTNKISYNKSEHFQSDYSEELKGEYPAFDLPDTEIFVNQRFIDINKKNILFGFIADDAQIMQPTSGWYQKTGEGWLFYFQPGHQISDFQNKNFKQVIQNTLEWKQKYGINN